MAEQSTEKEPKPSAILGNWFVSTPESEAMLAEEVEQLRQEYNAAVANGLLVRARRIERRMGALLRLTPGKTTD